jgi:hypothetical protein
MKTVLMVILQSLVLTAFFTFMAQTYETRRPATNTCRESVFSGQKIKFQKCANSEPTSRLSWRE